jgi:hypothetical protein
MEIRIFEIRNKLKAPMFETETRQGAVLFIWIWIIGYCFEIRASDFVLFSKDWRFSSAC